MNIRFLSVGLLILASSVQAHYVDTIKAMSRNVPSQRVRMGVTGLVGMDIGDEIAKLLHDKEAVKNSKDTYVELYGVQPSEQELAQRMAINRACGIPLMFVFGYYFDKWVIDAFCGSFIEQAKYQNLDFTHEPAFVRSAPRLNSYVAGILTGYLLKRAQLKYRDYKAAKSANIAQK